MKVYRSELNDWINGNISELDRDALIRVAEYYEWVSKYGEIDANEYIIEDIED